MKTNTQQTKSQTSPISTMNITNAAPGPGLILPQFPDAIKGRLVPVALYPTLMSAFIEFVRRQLGVVEHFKYMETGSAVDYGVAQEGTSDLTLYRGELPDHVARRARAIFLQNEGRAGRPNGTPLKKQVSALAPNMQVIHPRRIMSEWGLECVLEWSGPSKHTWWLTHNPFPIWPTSKDLTAPMSSRAFHLIFSRAEVDSVNNPIYQADMSRYENILDCMAFLRDLNAELLCNNWQKLFRLGINGWYYAEGENAPKGGASQGVAHAHLMREIFPIERASYDTVRPLNNENKRSIEFANINDGWGSGVRLRGYADNIISLAKETALVVNRITSKGHSFNIIVTPAVNSERRHFSSSRANDQIVVFIADRPKGVPDGLFKNEWAFSEFGRTPVIDDPGKFYALSAAQQLALREITNKEDLIKWVQMQRQNGLLTQLSRQIYDDMIKALQMVTEDPRQVRKLI